MKKVKVFESEIKRAVRRKLMENVLNEENEMRDTYSRANYKQSPREGDIEGIFGQYGEEIPPSVLRYMRKNPQKIIKRLFDVYGQQMFDYISKNLSTPELDIEVEDEMMIDEKVEKNVKKTIYSPQEVADAEKKGGGIQVDGMVKPTEDGGMEVTTESLKNRIVRKLR